MSLNISWKIYFLINIPWSRFGYSNFSFPGSCSLNLKLRWLIIRQKSNFFFFDSLEQYNIYIFFIGKKKQLFSSYFPIFYSDAKQIFQFQQASIENFSSWPCNWLLAANSEAKLSKCILNSMFHYFIRYDYKMNALFR